MSGTSRYGICNLDQLKLWENGDVTLTSETGEAMKVRIVGVDPNRVWNPLTANLPASNFFSFKHLQSGTAAVAYTFDSWAQVGEMKNQDVRCRTKKILEQEKRFMWLANEDVS